MRAAICLTGAAVLVAAALAWPAWGREDDLPDLGAQVEKIAADVAVDLQRSCPPAAPGDEAAFDRCRRALYGDSELRRNVAPRLLWGRRSQDANALLKDTNLTQFAPDPLLGMYLSLFMYSGEYAVEYVQREDLYLIRLRAAFRNQLPPGDFPYPFWHDEAKWGVYQAANTVLLWVDPKTAKIRIGQFTERGAWSQPVALQPTTMKFDGKWMWMDRDGHLQPRVTLFDGLFSPGNPYLAKLDASYRTLALRMRDAQCDACHVPENPHKMRRLVLMHSPAHAAGEISRIMKAVREDKMPLDESDVEQPLDGKLKRALLESGAAFEVAVQNAKDWETAHRALGAWARGSGQ